MSDENETINRREACNLSMVRRVAAMLDLDVDAYVEGQALPRGWQFILMGADTRRSQLRGDGFPGLGVPMPDLGFPRLMLGGRSVTYQADIPIGARLLRTSSIKSVSKKENDQGGYAIVTVLNDLQVEGACEVALTETQTYFLLPAGSAYKEDTRILALPDAKGQKIKTLTPDATLLFQFSALGFNTHKIHIDRHHATQVEGFPDLVVNGGLVTLLMTEFLREEFDVAPKSIRLKHTAPLFCNRPITLVGIAGSAGLIVSAFNDKNRLAVSMEVSSS
jgi:3-methylfumaryl-CoA hydratase